MLNLTPHAITINTSAGIITIEPSGILARVSVNTAAAGTVEVNGVAVNVFKTEYGEVIGLPEEGTPCIVSAIVAARCRGRAGVFSPRTDGTATRDDKGQIVMVLGLVAA